MENDEKLLIQLRDCFTAGYTLPQYCIDNKIKYPLFISEKKFSHFMWEVYVQFLYDKRMMPAFSFLDMPDDKINFWYNSYFLPPLTFKNISNVDVSKYSKVFFITLNKIDVKPVSAIYLDELTSFFNNYVYVEIPMLHFLRYHPKVKVFFTNIPSYIGKYPGGMELNKTLIDTYMLGKQLRNAEGNNLKTPLDKFGYTNKEVYELIFPTNKGTIANLDGFTTLKDNDHPLIRIKNGRRMTAYQPEHYKNKIYFIGPCYYLGSYAPFDKTIESYLQKILNESDLPYCVENEGQDYAGRCYDTFYNLYNLDCKAGDIIFVWLQSNLSNIIPSLDLSDAFDSPHDYKEIFVDKHHINELGYKILAERFFKFLTENNFFRDKEFNYPLPPPHITDTAYHHNSSRAA